MDIMKEMGLGQKWCSWIHACLSSALVSVLVNGSPTKEFKMKRGLRPSCTFLFLIVTEGLNNLMLEARDKGLYQGVVVGKGKVVVPHLQYADDAIFFRRLEFLKCTNLMRLLKCFKEISGLKINLSKSKLFGIGVGIEEVQRWAHDLGCGWGTLPFTYLGLSVGTNMNRIENWKIVVDKMSNKLST